MAFTYPERITHKAEPQQAISPCQMENNAFQHGETIVYKLYYNWNFVWLSAGEVTFRVKELNDQYHLSAHGQTYPSYEWFYKVSDKYDTYVDKKTLLPKVSIRDVSEGKYRLYDKITFDQNSLKASSLRGKSKDSAELTEYSLDGCMHDLLSIVYHVRNVNFNSLSANTEIPIKIFIDKEIWPLKVKYLGKEKEVKIKGSGKYNTIKFSPQVVSGLVFKEGTKMTVWASDDKNKIPLMVESPVSVGSVKAVLKEYNGLRYDMEAHID